MKIGNQDITSIYVGNEQICTIYVGNEQVYNGCSSPTGSFRWKATDVNDVETTRTCADADYYSHEVSSMTRVDLVYYVSGGVNSIKELEIGGCTKKLESSMCANMTGLTSVTMSDSVVDLDGGATFSACKNLVDVNISTGLTSIPVRMFASATSLSNITIPDNITSIGVEAFERSGIEDITIPSGVTSIGASAFNDCPNLRTVTMLSATPPTLGNDIFEIDDAGITRDPAVIYVPVGSLSAYTSSQYWSGYTDGGQWSQYAVIRENNPYARQYLSISGTEHVSFIGTSNVFQYSNDSGATWHDLSGSTSSTPIDWAYTNGGEVWLKGTSPIKRGDGIGLISFYGTAGTVTVKGNVMSLLYGDEFDSKLSLGGYGFYNLFYNTSELLDASNLVLPATTLTSNCYQQMFMNCRSLRTAPALPATTLANRCYEMMFEGCSSLISAPELPATTMANDCYSRMFNSCLSLTTTPTISATTMASGCCLGMFAFCTGLTTATELPATTLADYCYVRMFNGCSSLTTAPTICATTMATDCCKQMFMNCTSLTSAPALPATTLSGGCYSDMFKGCTSLTTAPTLPATTVPAWAYINMFSGCTSLSTITCYARDISAQGCTENWIASVASSGYFSGYSSANWQCGDSGIPSGWRVNPLDGGIWVSPCDIGGIGGGVDPDAPDPD